MQEKSLCVGLLRPGLPELAFDYRLPANEWKHLAFAYTGPASQVCVSVRAFVYACVFV